MMLSTVVLLTKKDCLSRFATDFPHMRSDGGTLDERFVMIQKDQPLIDGWYAGVLGQYNQHIKRSLSNR